VLRSALDIKGNPLAPYVNGTPLQTRRMPSNTNPPKNHPSQPNYPWLGRDHLWRPGGYPTRPASATHNQHLVKLENEGISWRAYRSRFWQPAFDNCPLILLP
jgi:hypothetical protein